jgi:hypothetical protein
LFLDSGKQSQAFRFIEATACLLQNSEDATSDNKKSTMIQMTRS